MENRTAEKVLSPFRPYSRLRRACATSLLLACALTPSLSQTKDSDKMLDKTFQTSKGALKYLLFVPKDYVATKKYPLVVSLRGAGNTYIGATNDNDQAHPWIEDSIQARVPHFIMVPECDGSWGGPIGPGLSNGILSNASVAVIEGIEDLKKQYSLDTNRFIITGFSLGGTGTYHMIEIKHDYWAAAVPAAAGPDTTKLATIAKTPIWHHQGSLDNNAGAGRRMALGLENRGHKVVRMVCEYTINSASGWRTAMQGGAGARIPPSSPAMTVAWIALPFASLVSRMGMSSRHNIRKWGATILRDLGRFNQIWKSSR
jgi:hypothetical protein